MTKKMNNAEELAHIKHLMNFSLNEGKANIGTSIEYQNLGADGKTYGIIREGSNYYIKVADVAKNATKNDFDYINGFSRRAENCYGSYNKALKQFDLKMMSLKEAYGNDKHIVIESWNPTKKEELSVEATEKMRAEIMRQRQIMENAGKIGKPIEECDCKGGKCKDGFCKDATDTPDMKGIDGMESTNIKGTKKPVVGGVKKQKFTGKAKTVKESVIGGGELDANPGTGVANTKKNNRPFTQNVCEDDDIEFDDEDNDILNGEDEGVDGAIEPEEDDELDVEIDDEEEFDDDEADDIDDDDFTDDMDDEIADIKDILSKIEDKLGIDEFDDDELYDDEGIDDEGIDDEGIDDEDEMKFESYLRRGRRVNEDRREFNYWGKHPAYGHEPFSLPGQNGADADGDLYDVQYGKTIGDGQPFEVDVDTLENAITEAISRIVKKK